MYASNSERISAALWRTFWKLEVRNNYLRDEILDRFFSTSFEIGKLGSGFGSFLSNLLLALGATTSGGFFAVADGDNVLISQLLVEVPRLDDMALPRYLARPPLFLCTVGGLRNSDELFATSTDISLVFLTCQQKCDCDDNNGIIIFYFYYLKYYLKVKSRIIK